MQRESTTLSEKLVSATRVNNLILNEMIVTKSIDNFHDSII